MNDRIDDFIHNELIPIQQMFKSYEELCYNPSFHIDGKIMRKCALKVQEVINIARELAKEV